ncbi:MAG: YHS domain-containing (seleno)protein [Proteobacteria bacterium]|nr:YHS domain-containing (seleno)protein [Pseudomonadota bacterium]
MKTFKTLIALVLASSLSLFSLSALAGSYENSVTGVNGYDLVSYQNSKKPIRGNGNYLAVHNGVTYLFSSADNQKIFESNPEKYVPAYGGYCAFGASVGKKFVGDPEVWRVVDGKLYLNLDAGIQKEWLKDVPGRIKTADAKWLKILHKAPSEL